MSRTRPRHNRSSRMGLNGWLAMFDNIYFLSQNFERDRYRLFGHLVEVSGGLMQASFKLQELDASRAFLAKVFAWTCALQKGLGYVDIEGIVWAKFPRCCP